MLFHFWKTVSISLELTWPPGPSWGSSRRLGLGRDLSGETCPGTALWPKGAGESGVGETWGVSMPFLQGLEVHYVQSACSVSNKNETGFYNQPKGNFM